MMFDPELAMPKALTEAKPGTVDVPSAPKLTYVNVVGDGVLVIIYVPFRFCPKVTSMPPEAVAAFDMVTAYGPEPEMPSTVVFSGIPGPDTPVIVLPTNTLVTDATLVKMLESMVAVAEVGVSMNGVTITPLEP